MSKISICAVVILACGHLTRADEAALKKVLHPGGVAFEWPAPGSWDVPRKATSENLLKGGDAEGDAQTLRKIGGWFTSSWLGSKAEDKYPLPGTPTSDIADGMGRNGDRAFHLRMSADAAPIVTAVWSTNVAAAGDGPYRISGWAKCGQLSKDGGSLEITFQSRKQSGDLCGEHWQRQRSKTARVDVPPGDWHEFHVDVNAMPEVARISLILAQRGPGELFLDNLSLVKTNADMDIRVIARSTGVLDGTVAIGSRELFLGGMWVKNESGREMKSPRLEFDLPAGFRLVGMNQKDAEGLREENVTVEGRPHVRASIPWTSRNGLRSRSYLSGSSQIYGLYADLPPREEPYAARARLTAEGYEGPWWDFRLLVLPRIEPVTPPKRVLLSGNIPSEIDGQPARDFLAAYRRWGMNAACCAKDGDDLRQALKESGLYMLNIDWFWRDNFRIMHQKWSKDLMPEDGWWVGDNRDGWATCPEYIAQGHITDNMLKPYYRKIFVENDLYHAWATNWEPNLWTRKGCFCPRCKKSFSAFAKLPEAEVTALDGKDLITKWSDEWQSCRRDLNNRLMRLAFRVFDDLSKERGKEIPCLLWVGPGAILEARGEMDIHPVLRECNAIAGWAYEGVDIAEGAKGVVNHLSVAEKTENVVETIKQLNNRPDFRYFHCVLGSFGSLVNTPEEMELDFLCSALARPWHINAWDMPESYDYRYAHAFARAARVIAAHEDMICDGEKSKDVSLTPLSPTHTGEETRKNLWARDFAKDGRRLYTIFNFDRNHRVFFTLQPETGEGKWILHDPVQRIVFTPEGDPKDGYCLHLGAARAAFLLLEPEGDPNRWQGYERVNCGAIRSGLAGEK
ncbi:MAG: hypothetical protein AB1696_10560 [Planctomycetota bacterium]